MQPEWELWLDTNISPAIAKWITEFLQIPAKSSYSLNLHQLSDLEIYNLAKTRGNVILISKDADFPELINRLGAPPKLINLKIGNCDNRTLWEFLKPNLARAVTMLTTMNSIIIVELD